MTNHERLKTLDIDGFAQEIERLAQDPLFSYIDLPKWLNASSDQPLFKGQEGVWTVRKKLSVMDKGPHRCMIIQEMQVDGKPYRKVIVQNKLGNYQLYTVPEEDIRTA